MKDPRKGNSDYYDLQEEPFPDVQFYLQHVTPETEVLELGCGTGRVLIPLAATCRKVTGVDYSADMIDKCRRKIKGVNVDVSKAALSVGDVTRLDMGQKFDLVIAPFRVMQALETDEEVDGFLATVKRHIAPGGSAILNVFHPNKDKQELRDNWAKPDEMIRWEKMLPDGQKVVHSEIYRRIDKENLVLFPELIYRKYQGTKLVDEFVQKIKMRCYYPDEFLNLMDDSGFAVVQKWGGYRGEPYESGTELVVKIKPA